MEKLFQPAATYKILRFFADASRPSEARQSGLTLQEAQAHCRDPRTRKEGVWFDGYEQETQVWEAELTDTFGGEANYSWVRRERLRLAVGSSDRQIVQAAKAAVGLTGVRCERSSTGEGFSLRPYDRCEVLFVEPVA